MAQSVARILGKDEVTGSNPVSSSKKKSRTKVWLFFLVLFDLHFSFFSFLFPCVFSR